MSRTVSHQAHQRTGGLFRVAVTGAGGAIGMALCSLLHERSVALHVIDRVGDALSPLVETFGATFAIGQATTSDEAGRHLDSAGDRLIGLVHLAGSMHDDPVLSRDPQVWPRTMSDNLTNAYHYATAFLERLPLLPTSVTGRIVYASSLAFRRGAVDAVAYSAAKAGLVGMTRALARRCGSRATVNAVAPGIIDSPMATPVIQRRRDQLLNEIPLGRFGSPRDVAGVIAFLLSEDAAYISGQCLNVDGGQVMS